MKYSNIAYVYANLIRKGKRPLMMYDETVIVQYPYGKGGV